MRHFFNKSSLETIWILVLVLYIEFSNFTGNFVNKIHIYRVVIQCSWTFWVKFIQIFFDKGAKAVIKWGCQTISALYLIPRPGLRALNVNWDLLNFFHLVLLVEVLPNEFFILHVSMVERLNKVFLKDFFKQLRRVLLLLQQLNYFAHKASFQSA